MKRPKITLHIFTSLDGKITGSFSETEQAKQAGKLFKNIGFNNNFKNSYHFDGWIYGRITAQEGFGQTQNPDLSNHALVEKGDFIINQGLNRYYISIDRSGKIGWKNNTASYGGQTAYVIEILTEQASNEYKNFLRKKQIPYLICGKNDIDFKLMLDKLYRIYQCRNLMLGGGGILNWTFLDKKLIDEISLVIAPSVDGNPSDAQLFNSKYLKDPHAIGLKLQKVKVAAGGALWLRYTLEGN